jgi:hypothetical protein
VCLASFYQDLLVDGMARTMDELGTDGVYLDGTEYPFACLNTEHGCGAPGAGGSLTPSYPIFAVRSAMRRIHEVVRSRRPEGLINVHNSTCMTIPTLGWATSYWDGEQFQGVSRGADVSALLPLDAFRAEFMGRQWGVPAEFLLAGQAYTYEQAWAFCLIHDVPVRPSSAADLELASALWRTMEEFGRDRAEFVPYWRIGECLSAGPAGVLASAWRRPGHGVLVAVANLGARRTSARVELDLPSLGLAASTLEAVDAVRRRALPVRGAALTAALPPLGWALLWLRPMAGPGSRRPAAGNRHPQRTRVSLER